MSSLSFSIDWDSKEEATGDRGEKETTKPERAVSEGQGKGAAWEINFTDSPGKPKKLPPKFLRESKSSPDQRMASQGHGKRSPSSGSSPLGNPPSSMRSSSAPMKANGSQRNVKLVPSTASAKHKSQPTTPRSSTKRDISPKKQLPVIRKPLLPVISPNKKTTPIPDLRSQSDGILTPRTTNRAAGGTSSHSSKTNQRPHSASSSAGPSGRKLMVSSQQMTGRGQKERQSAGGYGRGGGTVENREVRVPFTEL